MELNRRLTPEEQELKKKSEELLALETELAQRELELATLRAELRSFEARYIGTVGILYADLDEIEAKIAEAQARLAPKDDRAQQQAAQARAQAHQSAQAAGAVQKLGEQKKFTASENLKKLYREVAKRIHPDLATDEANRTRRQRLMAEANRAYEEGDEAKLRAILDEWESSPEAVEGEGAGADLIRAIRKIAQVEKRLSAIDTEMEQLKASDLYQLKVKIEEAENAGENPLAGMASQVEAKIAAERKRLVELTNKDR